MASKKKRRKKRNSHTLFYVLLLLVFCNLAVYSLFQFLNPVAIKSETYTLQLNETFDPMDNLKYVFFGSEEDVVVSGDDDIKVNTVGDYIVTYTYNGKSYPFTVSIVDTIPPVLECHDYTTDLIEDVEETKFIDSVKDDSQYTIKMESSQPLSSPGTTSVTITATDQYGNASRQTVSLNRVEDKEAPQLVDFEETIKMGVGQVFSSNDYKVTDNLDDNPVVYVDTSSLNTDKEGTYEITYQLRDRSGNEASYTQTVNVVDEKIAYLTFDDGPSQNTKAILDILDQYGIKATFFVIGTNEKFFPYMKEAAEAGHTIALHSLTHDYETIYSSEEAYFKDLEGIKKVVEDVTGVEADCIRFPGGSSNTVSANYSIGIMSKLVDAVEAAGYEYFDWNVSSGDAASNAVPAYDIIANATSFIGEPYAVMLFHDTDAKDTTVEALPAIIEAYLAAGYEFAPLTKTSYAAHHGVNN